MRPNFLRRDDWHFSSEYTPEERAAVYVEEERIKNEVAARNKVTWAGDILPDEKIMAYKDPDHEYLKMPNLDNVAQIELPMDYAVDSQPAEGFPMPLSWQDYQRLQGEIEACTADEALTKSERDDAVKLADGLEFFYPTFKEILKSDWELQGTPELHNAIIFSREKIERGVRKVAMDSQDTTPWWLLAKGEDRSAPPPDVNSPQAARHPGAAG